MTAIKAERLSKSFEVRRRRGRRELIHAVENVTFEVDAGERLAYIGPNGAGKSTSIKILTGILHPSHGTARVLGLVPWEDRRRLAGMIGALFGQRSQLWSELPPRRSLTLLAEIHGLEDRTRHRRIEEVAELVEATDLLDKPLRTASLGQRMRCELAASILHSPRVLFLDEPTIGLDLVARQRFRELIVRLNEHEGTTVFLTSHDVPDIEHVARRVIVINHGRVIYDGKVSALRRSALATKLVEVRFDTEPVSLEIPGVQVIKASETGYKLVADSRVVSIREVLDTLLDGYAVADISVTDPPLEEVIASIYEGRP